jgi:hypothetical protein
MYCTVIVLLAMDDVKGQNDYDEWLEWQLYYMTKCKKWMDYGSLVY